jgi:GTP:adenosylcobinamide-phosphate guanylyltransferase
MEAIVTAGGVPQPGEPLYEYTQGISKAMLDVAGKPMIQWVLDALCAASLVDSIVVMGLPPDSGLKCPKVESYIPSLGDMVANIRAGVAEVLRINPQAKHALVVSSDIPAITNEMVDWIVNCAMQTDEDAYYNVITRQVMEARFPTSKRSYIRLKDMEVCGGDMNVLATRLVSTNDEIWVKIVDARKNALKQAALLGFDTLLLLLFHAITLEGAVKKATKRLHITGRAIVCPYAEVGMDVDKPHQLEILRSDLARQQADQVST